MNHMYEEKEYLSAAIFMTENDIETIGSATKLLYPELARRYNTTRGSVERAIRDEVEMVWQDGDAVSYEKLFGYSKDHGMGHPTNSEFLAAIVLQNLWLSA